eukprot:jgi/Picsp_1/6522/NSC_03866-R1_anaphase-promoting complex subunit 2-like
MRDCMDPQFDRETQDQPEDTYGTSRFHCRIQGILLDRADKFAAILKYLLNVSQRMEEAMLHNANRGTDLTDIPTSLQSCIDIREQARETLMFLSSDALKYDESNRSLVSIQTVSKAQEIVFRSLVEKILFKKTGENFSLFEKIRDASTFCLQDLRNGGQGNILSLIRKISECLRELGLTDVVMKMAYASIENYLQDTCTELAADLSLSIIDEVSQNVFSLITEYLDATGLEMTNWKDQVSYQLYQVVGSLRIKALFDLVIEYPDSLPALNDLKESLKYTRSYSTLLEHFSAAIDHRLLHPGASTSDIIQHYMSTIRVMNSIDSSGYTLKFVSRPIQNYLRSRKDTIKCIVALLTEDGREESNDYTSFLLTSEGGPGTKNGYLLNDQSALEAITKWTVAPLEIAPETTYIGDGQNSVSLLTDIYGTKDHFITAYRTMLADKLIKKKSFDCSKELKTLELLKIRFGEAALHSAEVMMRDVIDSKRLDVAVKGHIQFCKGDKAPLDVKVLVLSKYFWPSERDIQFRIPEAVVPVLDNFSKIYHSLKAPRVLKWRKEIGGVTLCLTIGKDKLDFDVTPLQASILLQFVESEECTMEHLCNKLEISEEVLLQKINFWINEGVVRERRAGRKLVFCRNETLVRPSVAAAEYEDDQEQIQENPMNYLEPFILGMLTNFDSLPLERIHNMLKMFATDPPYNKSLVELGTFMTSLSLRDKVVLEGKNYRKKHKFPQ